MIEDLKITIIQSEIIWEDIKSNIEIFDKKINFIKEKTDLILLPEMFTTGFTMNAARFAESMGDETVAWLKKKSEEKEADIAGSIIIKEKGKFFNRLVWARSDGKIEIYDKKHLFSIAGEDKVYSGGTKKTFVDLKGWRIAPFICYDLRFPIWSANLNTVYDIAIYNANWPAKRSYAWDALLYARAIENQSYIAGINRIGTDGNGVLYSGGSKIIDPLGAPIFNAEAKEIIYTQTLKFEPLDKYRKNFPVIKDASA
ncbi:MAG: amidohydrolase [Deltaproteobacteria bacterium]|nr:amidohydrolase [Deltaproteobacteria bacterium]